MNQYKEEVQARWGDTAAYAEYTQKNPSAGDFEGMERIFEKFAQTMIRGDAPASASAQALVKELQDYITDRFYSCTLPILSGLGQMYAADERFQKNIDRYGTGTAAFCRDAIAAYCKQ